MSGDIPEVSETVQGQIKWFDPVKGFGFLADSLGGPDVLLHANVLQSFGQSSIADGALVSVRAVSTPRGRQAAAVLSIQPPPCSGQAPIPDLSAVPKDTLDTLPLLPARVKWFDKAKGFGFANVFGQRGDVFLHVEVLRHWGFADLLPGEAVVVRVVDGPRGYIAAQILAWDRAVPDSGAVGGAVGGAGGGEGQAGGGPVPEAVAAAQPGAPARDPAPHLREVEPRRPAVKALAAG